MGDIEPGRQGIQIKLGISHHIQPNRFLLENSFLSRPPRHPPLTCPLSRILRGFFDHGKSRGPLGSLRLHDIFRATSLRFFPEDDGLLRPPSRPAPFAKSGTRLAGIVPENALRCRGRLRRFILFFPLTFRHNLVKI